MKTTRNAAGVLAIMLLNVGDVFSTKIFTKPVTGAYEITEVLLLLTVYHALFLGGLPGRYYPADSAGQHLGLGSGPLHGSSGTARCAVQ